MGSEFQFKWVEYWTYLFLIHDGQRVAKQSHQICHWSSRKQIERNYHKTKSVKKIMRNIVHVCVCSSHRQFTENTQSTPTDDIFHLESLNITGLRKDVFPDTDSWKRLGDFFTNHNPVAQQVGKNNLLCTLLLHRKGTCFLIENSKMYYKVHTNTSDKI